MIVLTEQLKKVKKEKNLKIEKKKFRISETWFHFMKD